MPVIEHLTRLLRKSLAKKTVGADVGDEALVAGQGTVALGCLRLVSHIGV